jgi:glycerol-3-phosphate dehydrogenase
LNTRIEGVQIRQGTVQGVVTTRGEIPADIIINAAGLYADTISSMVGIDEFIITPRRGEYIVFDKTAEPHPQTILHYTPSSLSKGIYGLTTVEGNLLLGPTADDLSPEEKNIRTTTTQGQEILWRHGAELLQTLPSQSNVIKTFAGVRPEPPHGQYIIKWYDPPWGFINVAGIRSPGLTATPAIAEYVAREFIVPALELKEKSHDCWEATRQRSPPLAGRPPSDQARDNSGHPSLGRVVCRCSEVTEKEVVDAIHRIIKLGADNVTLDSIKFRTLAMFGHCQGTFCRIRIARIIAKELGLPLWEVIQSDAHTPFVIGDIKMLQSCRGGAE